LKKGILIATLCVVTLFCKAQYDTALYLKFPIIPPFKLLKVPDSSVFTKDNLVKKKTTIMWVFSPDCEHCQEMIKLVKANYKKFKKVQFVMASPLEFSYIKKFYEEYELSKYPAITVGRDPSYYFGTFYKVKSFPAFFIYNKKGELVNWFTGEVSIENLTKSY
jgi:thioredoxin-related protein